MTRLLGRWPAVVWLTAVWVLLWATFTPLTVVGGVLVAVAVVALFPEEVPAQRLVVRPLPALRLALYLVYDLVVSGAEVSVQVVVHGPRACGAIVRLPLFSTSERVVAVMANALSLAPGAMAVEVDLEAGEWFVYALGPRDEADVARVRRRTLDMQRRVLDVLGSQAERAAVRRALEEAR
jgi:multicomponent Na+:H+ antiporter subunit E